MVANRITTNGLADIVMDSGPSYSILMRPNKVKTVHMEHIYHKLTCRENDLGGKSDISRNQWVFRNLLR